MELKIINEQLTSNLLYEITHSSTIFSKLSNLFIRENIFESFGSAVINLCLLKTFYTDHLISLITTYNDFNEFQHKLQINYKGKYGWQKIQQLFSENVEYDTDEFKSIVKCVQQKEFPSTFEIPKNWTIYAPLR